MVCGTAKWPLHQGSTRSLIMPPPRSSVVFVIHFIASAVCQRDSKTERVKDWDREKKKKMREKKKRNRAEIHEQTFHYYSSCPLLLRVGFVARIVVFNEQRVEKVNQQQN